MKKKNRSNHKCCPDRSSASRAVPARKCSSVHPYALYGAEKGRHLCAGGGVNEPAERLYGALFPRTGGIHAGRSLHLRRADDPGGGARQCLHVF